MDETNSVFDDPGFPADLLAWRSNRTPGRIAVIDADSGDRWTYAEWNAVVDRVALALHDSGIASGDTFATLLDSGPIAAALPFAAVRRGVTLAPLNVELDSESIGIQLEQIAPTLLLCDLGTESVACERFDGPIRSIDEPTASPVATFDTANRPDGRDRDTTDASPDEPLDVDATALVVFTSGTTGQPKGVRLTLENLVSSAVASAQRLGVTPRDRWLSPLDTYHVGGIAPLIRAALYGTTVISRREFDAERTAAVLSDLSITTVSLVPTMLSRLLDSGWRPPPDLRCVLLGGGPAPDSLLDRCVEHEIPVCPTYGATETASQVATATPGENRKFRGTVGRPLPGTDVSIIADGDSCETGEIGELVVDGPTVSPGYLDADATAAAFDDGRFKTGDRGYRDEGGRLWIVGRSDDVIVTGGENVQPAVVSDAISAHPSVEDAAVVDIPDAEWGERVVALVVIENGITENGVIENGVTENDVTENDVTDDELRSFCRGRIPEFAVPKSITFADSLPRTPSGTIDRAAVRERIR